MLAPEVAIPEEAALRVIGSSPNRCHGQIEYARKANKLIAGLRRIYAPEAVFVREQPDESAMVGKVWQQFSEIANKQLVKATAHHSL
jgi:hypothetical protein